jgi:hypothetical protein
MKEKKPGWVYMLWKEPNLNLAIHEKSGWVYFEDGTKYSPKELNLLRENGAQVTIELHRVKKIFSGEIVGVDNGNGLERNNQIEQSKGGNGKSDGILFNSHPAVPGNTGGGAESENGELEIF